MDGERKDIRKKEKKIGRELELVEKFLGIRKLEGVATL